MNRLKNISNSVPPNEIIINGNSYKINYDFRVWADISLLLEDFIFDSNKKEDIVYNIELIKKIQNLAFGKLINEDINQVMGKVIEFLRGYPKISNGYYDDDLNKEKIYSFKHDMNYIILAIRNQSGIDLTYCNFKKFHWWLFLLEFETLEDRHYISQVMKFRNYKGEDKDYNKIKNIFALPREIKKSDEVFLQKIDELFYDT